MVSVRTADDFARDPTYERRAVAFYDVLGWRNHIARAATQEVKIGELRRLILRASRMLGAQQERISPDIRYSTFSDNIVISVTPDEKRIIHLFGNLACFQLGSAASGFLVRGGVTIVNLIHDNESVFGPGLNRAYALESTVAIFPRIIVDRDILAALGHVPFFVAEDNGLSFLDPFTHRFNSFMSSIDTEHPPEFWSSVGLPDRSGVSLKRVESTTVLQHTLNLMKPTMRGPLADKEWNKMAWLYDRVATQLGVPRANSYPRVRPDYAIV
jgi:hypothetical protein